MKTGWHTCQESGVSALEVLLAFGVREETNNLEYHGLITFKNSLIFISY